MEYVLISEQDRVDTHEDSYEKDEAPARVQIVPLALQVLEQFGFDFAFGIVEHQLKTRKTVSSRVLLTQY